MIQKRTLISYCEETVTAQVMYSWGFLMPFVFIFLWIFLTGTWRFSPAWTLARARSAVWLALHSQYVTQQQEEWLVSHMCLASLERQTPTCTESLEKWFVCALYRLHKQICACVNKAWIDDTYQQLTDLCFFKNNFPVVSGLNCVVCPNDSGF